MVFLCTEISGDTHSSNHTYTDTIRWKKKEEKLEGINMSTILIY